VTEKRRVRMVVNGEVHQREVAPRLLLSDFLREELGLVGTNVGCEHGSCGACTVLADGDSVRSCLLFAVQMDGAEIETVEGLADGDELHAIQQAFRTHHGLQCGFCTPGMLLSALDAIRKFPLQDDDEIRRHLAGNLCRCTGYDNIVTAVREAARAMRDGGK
jgi:carbon-monoxide dehydrogenase small subunit